MIILRQKEYSGRRPIVYLLCGLPGSGKSTWCRENHPDLPIVSRDIIRAELGYTSGPDEKARLDNWQEDKVTKKENEYIEKYLMEGKDFILDDTNLKSKYRKPLLQKLYRGRAYVVGVNFDTPLSICIERRKNQIDPEVLKKMYNTMNKLDDSEVSELVRVK